MLVRLDPQLAFELGVVAEVDGQHQSDVVRVAVGRYLARRRADPARRNPLTC